MWIYTRDFYTSIVAHFDGGLLARFRTREHAERFQELLPCDIIESSDTDYRFRARVTVEDVADLIFDQVHDIDYTNFKDEVSWIRGGGAEEKAMHRMWAAGKELQAETMDD